MNPFFSLHIFYHEKISPETFIFCFRSVTFLCHIFSFNIFPYFLSSLFFDHFFLSSICSSLFAFSPFFSSLLSQFFLYFSISVFLSLFFLYLMIPYLFPSSPLLRMLYLFQLIFLLSLLILMSLFSFFFSNLFLHLRLCCFSTQKKSKISVVVCLKTKCLYFLNPPVICVKSLMFFLLASSFSLV